MPRPLCTASPTNARRRSIKRSASTVVSFWMPTGVVPTRALISRSEAATSAAEMSTVMVGEK
jgi:hypothetical protein